jgi:phosphatidate cytidylyltransferase
MNNILVRALSGAVFVALVIGSLGYNLYATVICIGLFTVLGLNEFYNLFKESKTVSVSPIMGTFVGFSIFALFALYFLQLLPQIALVLAFPLLFLSMIAELWRMKENPLFNLGVLFLGFIYVVLPFVLLIFMHAKTIESYTLIFMFLLIWTNDTFAYLTGRWLGKTKLIERISPNKTWEGTIGGILMTFVIALVIAYFNDQTYLFWVISAAIIAPGAIFGDLLESLFKRSLNIKDTGNIMPGHGGILDRFDAVLFAVPFFFCWWLFYTYF